MEVDDASPELQLLRACQNADLQAASALLSTGADVHFSDAGGRTPLLEACTAGSLQLVSSLQYASADFEAVDAEGRGVALLAAESGSLELLRWLADQGFASFAECSEDGSTPLLCAATSGNVEMLSWLLDGPHEGPNIALTPSLEERDGRGANALMCAAEAGELAAMRELLRRGMASSAVDDGGAGVCHYAAAGGHVDAVQYCVGKLKMSSEARDAEGNTPLLVAAGEGNIEVVVWLLPHGSSLSERSNDGMSAFMAAAAGEHAEVLEVLTNWDGGRGAELWLEDVARYPQLVLNFVEMGASDTVGEPAAMTD